MGTLGDIKSNSAFLGNVIAWTPAEGTYVFDAESPAHVILTTPTEEDPESSKLSFIAHVQPSAG